MRWTTASPTLLLLAAACAADPAPQPQPAAEPLDVTAANVTPAEADAVRSQVEMNWNVDLTLQCHAKMTLRAVLAPDGAVQRIDNVETFAPGDPCLTLQDSARRAILLSSPLKLPPGKAWPSVVFVFDGETLLGQ